MEIDRQADRFAAFRQEIGAAGLIYGELNVMTLKPEERTGLSRFSLHLRRASWTHQGRSQV
jgi:hypothetical protein